MVDTVTDGRVDVRLRSYLDHVLSSDECFHIGLATA